MTLISSLVSVVAATALLAASSSGTRTQTCEPHFFIHGLGNCPASVEQFCEDNMPKDCGINEEYSNCEEQDPGYAVYCETAF